MSMTTKDGRPVFRERNPACPFTFTGYMNRHSGKPMREYLLDGYTVAFQGGQVWGGARRITVCSNVSPETARLFARWYASARCVVRYRGRPYAGDGEIPW